MQYVAVAPPAQSSTRMILRQQANPVDLEVDLDLTVTESCPCHMFRVLPELRLVIQLGVCLHGEVQLLGHVICPPQVGQQGSWPQHMLRE